MQIHLKKGEKLYLNGAVLRAGQRCTIDLLNNAAFLLEAHVMQPDEARSPMQQLYFVVQTMLMEPGNSGLTKELYWHQSACLMRAVLNPDIRKGLEAADACVKADRYFEALRTIRRLIPLEAGLMLDRREVA
jgi:flagellar biosynthesis repressor protein FlbT